MVNAFDSSHNGSEYVFVVKLDKDLSGDPCTVKNTFYMDADGDGYGNKRKSIKACIQPDGYVPVKKDCDDNDPNEYLGQIWYKDKDNDGYSDGKSKASCKRHRGYKLPSELTAISGECADKNIAVNPGATEGPAGAPTCTDKKDNDCDRKTDQI